MDVHIFRLAITLKKKEKVLGKVVAFTRIWSISFQTIIWIKYGKTFNVW